MLHSTNITRINICYRIRKVKEIKGYILYKIYYSETLVYLGRTKQDLQQRIRGHFFAKPMHRKIDIFMTTRIEYAEFLTEADMFLYEVYFINKYHSPLNVDDRAHDDLTVELPEVEWKQFDCRLMDKWKEALKTDENDQMYNRRYGPIMRLADIKHERGGQGDSSREDHSI
jgi:hypothetical protein